MLGRMDRRPRAPKRRRAAAVAWLAMAAVAGFMGFLLVISDEPGATHGRWHLLFAALGVLLGIWSYRLSRMSAAFVIASAAVTLLIAAQAYLIGEFAYLGLTNILIVIAAMATVLAIVAWYRGR